MIPFSRPVNWLYVDGGCHELGHTWHPSCIYCAGELFAIVFWSAVKVYFPLYLLSDVLRGRHPKAFLLHTVPHILRSCCFLATNGGGFIVFVCLLRKLFGRFYLYTTAFLPSFLAAVVAILFERKSRRGMLAGYVGTLAVEVLYSVLKHRGYVCPVRYGEVLLFSFASAVLIHGHRSKGGLQDAVGAALRLLFTPPLPAKLLTLTKNFRNRPPSLRNNLTAAALNIALVSGWSFVVGYLLQTVIALIRAGTKAVYQPGRLKRALLNTYSAKFGAFLAALTGGFKVLNAVFLGMPIPRDVRVVLAGLLAGLSMGFIKSSTISLYAAGKALEVLYLKAVGRGWLKKCYYGDLLLYALSCAILFHAAFFEAHNLRLGYWLFLNRITYGKLEKLNYDALDHFETQASTRVREFREQTKEKQD